MSWRETLPVVAIMELFGGLVTFLKQLVSILIPFPPLTLLFLKLAYLVLREAIVINLIWLLYFDLRVSIFTLVSFSK